jgi:hypothetical protein
MRGNKMFNPSTWLNKIGKLHRVSRSRRSFVVAPAHYLFGEHPEAQQVVEMRPETFLRLTIRPDMEPVMVQESRYATLADKMIADKELDPPYLEIVSATGQVLAHEGRHRAAAARSIGLDRIPVLLYHYKMGRGRRSHNGYIDLTNDPEARLVVDPENDLIPQWV